MGIKADKFNAIKKIHENVLNTIDSYLHLAQGIDLRKEEDYNDFSDAILEDLLKNEL